jgi:group I intron endonuclease
MHYIYKITNTINGKIYIGQTNNPKLRWSQHKSNAKYNKGQQIIIRAMSKHGVDNFIFEEIATCRTLEDVNHVEEIIIQQYDSRNPEKGYNLDRGGNTSPRTPEVVAKTAEGIRKYYETHHHFMKGQHLPEEWKANIAKASIGKAGTNTGKTFDKEWVLKMSKSMAGKERISERRFSQEEESEICRLYEEGKSTYKLGDQFKCNRSLILSILDRGKVKRRRSNYIGHSNGCNRFTPEQELEICNMYKSGNFTKAELARKFECGKATIFEILKRDKSKLL